MSDSITILLTMLKAGIFFVAAFFIFGATAAVKQPIKTKTEAVVFIDSAVPANNRIARGINEQFYHSKTLKSKMSVFIVDISALDKHTMGAAHYIEDTKGIWVEKYRPTKIPALFCIKGRHIYPERKIESAQEIRSCL